MLCTISNLCYSQNIRVTYHTDYTRNAIRPNRQKSEHTVLNIGKESSEFYSLFRARVDSLLEAMDKRGASYSEYQKEKSRIPDGIIGFRIYKNYPQKGQLTFTDKINTSDYKYTEPLEKPQWKIEKETKEILGYKCQKATTKFRGRTWNVWYTTDIPVQEGPWKLWGLPGLILEAKDDGSLYNFVAIGLERKGSNAIAERKKKYISCTHDEYMKQKTEFEKDPIAAISRGSGSNIKITDRAGNSVKPSKIEYIDIEID